MRKKLVTMLLATLASLTAFAQGKVLFANDSLHLAYWGFGGLGLTGQPVGVDTPPGFPALAADLYMGTSSSTLYLYSSTTFANPSSPGKWPSVSVQANANATTGAPAIPGGTTVFVEVAVRSTERAPLNTFDFLTAVSTYQLFGASTLFNFTLGSSVTYPVLWGANGNWPAGTFNMDQYFPGARGAIAVGIPEPSAIALLGLGATLLFFRPKSTPSRIL